MKMQEGEGKEEEVEAGEYEAIEDVSKLITRVAKGNEEIFKDF